MRTAHPSWCPAWLDQEHPAGRINREHRAGLVES